MFEAPKVQLHHGKKGVGVDRINILLAVGDKTPKKIEKDGAQNEASCKMKGTHKNRERERKKETRECL